jgi:hypothetical protein
MRRRVGDRGAHRIDDVVGRGEVRVTDAERDHVDAFGTLRGEPPVELREQVRRE